MSRPIAADPIAYPPRGMNRAEAARYIGVSATLFDEMVSNGRMPRAKRMSDGRTYDGFPETLL